MLAKQYFNLLIKAGLFIVSLRGLLIHLKIHPPTGPSWHYLPYTAGVISVLVVTVLFFFRRGYQFAYIINGMLVIIGTIAMTHFSLAFPAKVISISGIATGSMLPFILVIIRSGNENYSSPAMLYALRAEGLCSFRRSSSLIAKVKG